MKNPAHLLPSTRREFLQFGARGLGLLAFSRFAPGFLVESVAAGVPRAEKDRSILVLVQLAGGNDGLNTVVPYSDDRYYRLRPTLGLKNNELLTLDSHTALHSSCAALHELYKGGQLGIVQSVGYPNPNRSHFRSTEIWETASESEDYLTTGWVGRYFDNACNGTPKETAPCGVCVGNSVPQSFLSANVHQTFALPSARGGRRANQDKNLSMLEEVLQQPAAASGMDDDHHDHSNAGYLRHTMMDALVTEKKFQSILADYRPDAEYPGNQLAAALRQVAALIAAGNATRVYYVTLGGFDTHSGQRATQANLLRTLSDSLAAFQRDLTVKKLDGQVLTMTFSEFGRRAGENDSNGTDHGTAAPLFVLGSHVKGGLHGTAPSLNLRRNEDLKFTTDFRSVYATVIDRWLGADSRAILGSEHTPLAFL